VEELAKVPKFKTIYFYCRHADRRRNSFVAVAAGLLAQLIWLNPHFLDYLYEKLSAKGVNVLSSEGAKELLEVGVRSCPKMYIIIDGLDECKNGDQQTIITWFRNIIEKLPREFDGSLRCLFLSQEDKVSTKSLRDLPRLELRSEEHGRDIAAFVERLSRRAQERFKIADDERDLLTEEIKNGADGTCCITQIYECSSLYCL